jgi:hypothetical protein
MIALDVTKWGAHARDNFSEFRSNEGGASFVADTFNRNYP